MNLWVDTHCHIQGLDESEGDAAAIVDRAVGAGVPQMVCVGTDAASSRRAVELAGERPEVWATVGLHPHDASRLDEEWDALARLAESPRVVAIGETGFDLHYRHSDEASQSRAFRRQIRLAKAQGLALVVHTRDAWDRTFEVLVDEGVPERTVIHCFTGGPAEAERAVALGAYISFSGIVTFSKADDVRAAATVMATHLDRVLVETDSPFLTPVPHRGKVNEPMHVPLVGEAVAAAMELPSETVARATAANAKTVFGLP